MVAFACVAQNGKKASSQPVGASGGVFYSINLAWALSTFNFQTNSETRNLKNPLKVNMNI